MIETIIICGTVLAVAGMVYRFMNRLLDVQLEAEEAVEPDMSLKIAFDELKTEFDAIKLTMSMRNGR